MKEFPYSDDEWSRVNAATSAVLNATLANDSVLRASVFAELQEVLADLKSRHGDHPVLWETEADFSHDATRQQHLYRQAIGLAVRWNLRTYSIRMSLAQLLLEDFSDADQALQELLACEGEIHEYADEYERCDWSKLVADCQT